MCRAIYIVLDIAYTRSWPLSYAKKPGANPYASNARRRVNGATTPHTGRTTKAARLRAGSSARLQALQASDPSTALHNASIVVIIATTLSARRTHAAMAQWEPERLGSSKRLQMARTDGPIECGRICLWHRFDAGGGGTDLGDGSRRAGCRNANRSPCR